MEGIVVGFFFFLARLRDTNDCTLHTETALTVSTALILTLSICYGDKQQSNRDSFVSLAPSMRAELNSDPADP